MVLFKSCPRCSGDRSVEKDHFGSYILCLLCGHVAYPAAPQPAAKPPREHRVKVAQPAPRHIEDARIGDPLPGLTSYIVFGSGRPGRLRPAVR